MRLVGIRRKKKPGAAREAQPGELNTHSVSSRRLGANWTSKAFAISSQSDLVHSCEVRLLFPTMGELGIDDETKLGILLL
jgi:hypothetical protein